MNSHEKCFESSLEHYQNKIRSNGKDFYWHRPHKPKWAKGELPCDFWFFDESFVAVELKYRNGRRISKSQIKEHQIKTLQYFSRYKCRSYLVVSFNFQKNLTPGVADNFAINIQDAMNYFNNYSNVLKLEDQKLWKGIELIWKPRSNSYNLDPIMLPKNRVFNVRKKRSSKVRSFKSKL